MGNMVKLVVYLVALVGICCVRGYIVKLVVYWLFIGQKELVVYWLDTYVTNFRSKNPLFRSYCWLCQIFTATKLDWSYIGRQ